MSFNSQRETVDGNLKVEFIFPVHEIDSFNGEELKVYIEGISGEVDSVVINFSDITYLNSSGLRELIQLFKVLKEKGLIERVGSNKTGYWKIINKGL